MKCPAYPSDQRQHTAQLADHAHHHPFARVELLPLDAVVLAMMYKLGLSAERSRRRLRGLEWLAKVVEGVKFRDGIEVKNAMRVDQKHQSNGLAT
jgi:hypothetical protein